MKTAMGLLLALGLPSLGVAQTTVNLITFNSADFNVITFRSADFNAVTFNFTDSNLRIRSVNSSLFEFGTTPDPGVSYATGSGSAARALPMSTSASSVRTHSFDGSGYFTSSGDSVDRAFALRLGNGVNPRATAGIQIQAVPEPSTVILGLFGAGWFVLRRKSRR